MGPKGDDISKRPAWVQPGKCAAHPWRPLQWDHVSQAQLIAFEAGLRGTVPSPRAADQQSSQPCRTVAWENDEQLAAGPRQPVSHHRQQQQQRQQQQLQQQQEQLSDKLCDARQDSRAGMHGHAWAAPAGTSKHDGARVCDSRHSCSLVARHSTQGYAVLHKPKQAGTAASPTCQHSNAQRPKQPPSTLAPGHQSAGREQSSTDSSCLLSNTKGASSRADVQRDNRLGSRMACMSPAPTRIGASSSPGQGSPSKAAVSPSKVQNQWAAGCSTQPVSAHGNAQPAALPRGSSQQKRQHKHGSSASPTRMQNWVRWESDQDKVK